MLTETLKQELESRKHMSNKLKVKLREIADSICMTLKETNKYYPSVEYGNYVMNFKVNNKKYHVYKYDNNWFVGIESNYEDTLRCTFNTEYVDNVDDASTEEYMQFAKDIPVIIDTLEKLLIKDNAALTEYLKQYKVDVE
jgi:hypothetical protein